MTKLEDMISIETPTFILIHKNSNASSLSIDMEIENNSFQLPGFYNLSTKKASANLILNTYQVSFHETH